tara:strand:+ start:165 stop:332 length:168 start_codon:yes stop_codon:yes gene_type:complete
MKYTIIVIFLLSACTQNYTKQNINNFDFLDNITIEEFRIKLNEYADKSSYPNIDN